MNRPTPNTPEDAIRAFYDAFEARSVEAMMANWARRLPVACIHPMESRLDTRAGIERSWATMFRAAPPLRIELNEIRLVRDGTVAVQIVEERIQIEVDGGSRPPVLATNVFELEDGVWRMTLHHASAPPQAARPRSTGSAAGKPHQLH